MRRQPLIQKKRWKKHSNNPRSAHDHPSREESLSRKQLGRDILEGLELERIARRVQEK